jgi:hypothetical protein
MEIKIKIDESEELATALNERMAAAMYALKEGLVNKTEYSFDLFLGDAFTIKKEIEPDGRSAIFTIVPGCTEIKAAEKKWQAAVGVFA